MSFVLSKLFIFLNTVNYTFAKNADCINTSVVSTYEQALEEYINPTHNSFVYTCWTISKH